MKKLEITIGNKGEVKITGNYLSINELYSIVGLLEIETIDRYVAEEIYKNNEEINNDTLKKHFFEAIHKIQFAVLEYVYQNYGMAKRGVEIGGKYGKNN